MLPVRRKVIQSRCLFRYENESEERITDMKEIRLSVWENRKIKEQGDLFGIFFEDLNHAADGGLYGEMVRNRSFEFDRIYNKKYRAMTAWKEVQRGDSLVQTHVEQRKPRNLQNPHL